MPLEANPHSFHSSIKWTILNFWKPFFVGKTFQMQRDFITNSQKIMNLKIWSSNFHRIFFASGLNKFLINKLSPGGIVVLNFKEPFCGFASPSVISRFRVQWILYSPPSLVLKNLVSFSGLSVYDGVGRGCTFKDDSSGRVCMHILEILIWFEKLFC